MPTIRDMLLFVREDRPKYELWLRAVKNLRMGGDMRVECEVNQTDPILFSDRECTRAAMYAMGYGRHRERVLIKVVELRLAQ